jgi:parallel beta-helix repeat protein
MTCGMLVAILSVSMCIYALDIPRVGATGTIYIRSDGTVDPPTAPIQREGEVYVVTREIHDEYSGITIERNSIILDGAGFPLYSFSTTMSERTNVTVTNLNLTYYGSICLNNSSNNTLAGNVMSVNGGGILLDNSSNNNVTGNVIGSTWGQGIVLQNSTHNIISNNRFDIGSRGGPGIRLDASFHNNITLNEAGGGVGLELTGSSDNYIFGNTISGGHYTPNGLSLSSSSGNCISGNDLRSGVSLSSSSDNLIVNNEISLRVDLTFSSNNSFSANNIHGDEDYWFMLSNSSDNRFYHNNIDLPRPLRADDYANSWDDGYPSGGNYWNDYAGDDTFHGPYQNETGSDGIGDTPRLISAGNRDNYPFMEPYYEFDNAVTYAKPTKTVVASGQLLQTALIVENQGHNESNFNIVLNASYVYTPREQTHTLQGNADQGWNNTVPGPTITCVEGDTVHLKLEPTDTLHHMFYVDYNGNAFPDAGEPQSPPFINTNIEFSLLASTVGNFTYYCAYNQDTMYGQLVVDPAPQFTLQIGSANVTLDSKSEANVSLVWNTTGILMGKYALSTFIPPVEGELDTADNSLDGGLVYVSILGDVTGPGGLPDGKVDMRDVGSVARIFGAKSPDPEYNPNFDIDDNGKIDMKDVGTVARHFGEHLP